MNCTFVAVTDTVISCLTCARSIPSPTRVPIDRLVRACIGINSELQHPCVFVESTVSPYEPWLLYKLTDSQINTCPIKPIVLTEDGTRVGSRLHAYLRRKQFDSCDCANLRVLLDAADAKFIDKYSMDLSRRIHESAKKVGWHVPFMAVVVALRFAVRHELLRIR